MEMTEKYLEYAKDELDYVINLLDNFANIDNDTFQNDNVSNIKVNLKTQINSLHSDIIPSWREAE